MEETKKKTRPISDTPGGPKATLTEETLNANSIEAQHAQGMIEKAGRFLAPIGAEYLGSATVHYYRVNQIDGADQLFLCQCNVKNVSEVVASLGWQQLRATLLKAVGRPEPRQVRN